jgi:hypothetical protein
MLAQDYAKAILLYKEALSISPMYPDAWFKLGCAAMREEDWETSVQAFLRVVQQVRAAPHLHAPAVWLCFSPISSGFLKSSFSACRNAMLLWQANKLVCKLSILKPDL